MTVGASDWTFATAAYVVIIVLALAVIWLIIAIIRMRFESSVNRRVIASLQKVRPIHEEKSGWLRSFSLAELSLYALLLWLGVILGLTLLAG